MKFSEAIKGLTEGCGARREHWQGLTVCFDKSGETYGMWDTLILTSHVVQLRKTPFVLTFDDLVADDWILGEVDVKEEK